MRASFVRLSAVSWFVALWMLAVASASSALAADVKVRAYLVWGTDTNSAPSGKNYKAVEPEIEKKLKSLPLKWKQYFEVSRTNFVVGSASTKVAVSSKCELEVKGLNNSMVEVVMRNKGEEVARQKQPLPADQYLIVSGNAPNSSGWFVVLKKVE